MSLNKAVAVFGIDKIRSQGHKVADMSGESVERPRVCVTNSSKTYYMWFLSDFVYSYCKRSNCGIQQAYLSISY